MVKLEKALRQEEILNWGNGRVKVELRQKTIKGLGYTWKPECIFSRETGGIINIWEHEPDTIKRHGASDDNNWKKLDEIHFRDWRNALDEYKAITDTSSMLDLCKRNM